MWLTVAVLVDVPSALIAPCLGLQVSPAMNEPYKATGFAEFWGKRYNLVVSSTLRFSVYEPLLGLLQCKWSTTASCSRTTQKTASNEAAALSQQQDGRCRGSCRRCQLARALATTAVFAVSGLWHEICVW